MAGGALVPHVLPSGVTVMVPDYLAAQAQGGQALAMPPAPPRQGPDLRTAGPGGGPSQWGPASAPVDPSVFANQDAASIRRALTPPAAAGSHETPDRVAQLDKLGSGGKPPAGKVDPSTLATPQRAAPKSDDSGGMDPIVRKVYDESLSRRGGGGQQRAPGLVTSSIKSERTPGRELLPEMLQQYGLTREPDLGEEVDPNAAQPTIGDAEPVMRKVRSPLNRAADAAGQYAEREFGIQEQQRHEEGLAKRTALIDQSNALDQNLTAIAERRKKIADLQSVADQRMQEAESVQPKSRQEIWEDKGPVAQVLAMIGMAIGGYTQGLGRNGGHNPAWEMVNKVLDDAVDDERYKSEKRMKLGLAAKSDYERAVALYGDQDAAQLDTRGRKIANVLAMTQAAAADRALDAASKDRAMQLNSAARQALLENNQRLYDALNGTVMKQEITQQPGKPTGGGKAPTIAEALHTAAGAKKDLDIISGKPSEPLKASDLKDVNESDAALSSVRKMLDRYKSSDSIPGLAEPNVASRAVRGAADFVAGSGSGSKLLDSPEERANRQNTENLVAGIIQSISGAGVSNQERERLTDMVRGARTKSDLENVVKIVATKNGEFRRLANGGRPYSPPEQAASERVVE